MSDRRQVLQEAEKALEPFAVEADLYDRVTCHDSRGEEAYVLVCPPIRLYHQARSALALIRASLAEGDLVHPSAVTADAIAKTILDSITNHRDLRLHLDITDENLLIGLAHGWREQISAALNAKEQA